MHKYQTYVKEFLVGSMIAFRREYGLTKAAMSARLRMDPRSYWSIEDGKYSLSAASLMFLLISLEDVQTLELIHAFESYLVPIEQGVSV